jgi:hypothetical protein
MGMTNEAENPNDKDGGRGMEFIEFVEFVATETLRD